MRPWTAGTHPWATSILFVFRCCASPRPTIHDTVPDVVHTHTSETPKCSNLFYIISRRNLLVPRSSLDVCARNRCAASAGTNGAERRVHLAYLIIDLPRTSPRDATEIAPDTTRCAERATCCAARLFPTDTNQNPAYSKRVLSDPFRYPQMTPSNTLGKKRLIEVQVGRRSPGPPRL